MLTTKEFFGIGCAFILGLVLPILLSGVSMMISFGFGISMSRLLVPLISVSGLSEEVVLLGNGVLYAGIALLIVLFRRSAFWRR